MGIFGIGNHSPIDTRSAQPARRYGKQSPAPLTVFDDNGRQQNIQTNVPMATDPHQAQTIIPGNTASAPCVNSGFQAYDTVPGGAQQAMATCDQYSISVGLPLVASQSIKGKSFGIIVDNSISMQIPDAGNPNENLPRWNELTMRLPALVEVIAGFGAQSVQVKTFPTQNQPSADQTFSLAGNQPSQIYSQVEQFIGSQQPNSRSTPLGTTLESMPHKDVILIPSDGEPTGEPASKIIAEIKNRARQGTRFGLLICSGSKPEWMEQLDNDPEIGHMISTVDDQNSEMKQVYAEMQGPDFPRAEDTAGLWMMQQVCPGVPTFDLLDEPYVMPREIYDMHAGFSDDVTYNTYANGRRKLGFREVPAQILQQHGTMNQAQPAQYQQPSAPHYQPQPQQMGSPYQSQPQQMGNPYQSQPQQMGNPYQSQPQQMGSPYQSQPQQMGSPYQSQPQQMGNSYQPNQGYPSI